MTNEQVLAIISLLARLFASSSPRGVGSSFMHQRDHESPQLTLPASLENALADNGHLHEAASVRKTLDWTKAFVP
jgi:hypothetical protein